MLGMAREQVLLTEAQELGLATVHALLVVALLQLLEGLLASGDEPGLDERRLDVILLVRQGEGVPHGAGRLVPHRQAEIEHEREKRGNDRGDTRGSLGGVAAQEEEHVHVAARIHVPPAISARGHEADGELPRFRGVVAQHDLIPQMLEHGIDEIGAQFTDIDATATRLVRHLDARFLDLAEGLEDPQQLRIRPRLARRVRERFAGAGGEFLVRPGIGRSSEFVSGVRKGNRETNLCIRSLHFPQSRIMRHASS